MRYAILLLLFLTGCSTVTIKKGDVEFSRSSFGVNLQVPEISFWQDQDGYVLTVKQIEMNQTSAIAAAVEGAVRGAK